MADYTSNRQSRARLKRRKKGRDAGGRQIVKMGAGKRCMYSHWATAATSESARDNRSARAKARNGRSFTYEGEG